MSNSGLTLPGPLVSVDWLASNLDQVVLADVRWAMDRGPKTDDYAAGHLPGAVFVDLDADLSSPPGSQGRHPLPSAAHFADVRARLGLYGAPVVAYDDQSGAQAARLWWMLDAIGHPAAVLDGGMQAWTGPMETGPAAPSASATDAEAGPDVIAWPADRFIDVDDVLDAIGEGGVMIDARSADRFAGHPNPIDSRPGHVPGARSRPWTDNVADNGQLHDPSRLQAELAELGVVAGVDLIASCGSGVTGCHDLLAARVAGFDGGRLYTGSWSEWSNDPDRPVATDL